MSIKQKTIKKSPILKYPNSDISVGLYSYAWIMAACYSLNQTAKLKAAQSISNSWFSLKVVEYLMQMKTNWYLILLFQNSLQLSLVQAWGLTEASELFVQMEVKNIIRIWVGFSVYSAYGNLRNFIIWIPFTIFKN